MTDRPAEVYDDRPRTCPACRAPFPGFEAYWDHAETDHSWVWQNGKIVPPEDEQIGAGRSALYVLGIWPTRYVHRDTLRALANVNLGTGTSSRTKVSKSLRKAQADGHIARSGDWIRIDDQRALYERAVDRISSPSHEKFLAVRSAIPVLARQIAAERNAAQREARERELAIIRRLMQPYDGRVPTKGRSARVVAAGRIT